MVIRSQVPVPRSQLRGGAPGGGAISHGLSRVREALGNLTDHLVKGRIQRETIEARTAAREGLFALEEQYAKADDFNDIGERFAEDSEKLFEQISQGFTIKSAATQFEESYAELAISAGARVRRAATRREGDIAVAALDTALETGAEAFASGRISAQEAEAAAAEEIDRAESAGWITAQAAVARAGSFRKTVLDASALKELESNPRGINLEAEGPYGALGDRRRLELKSRRDSYLARDRANQERQMREVKARARMEFSDLKDVLDAGFLPEDDRVERVGQMIDRSGDAALMKEYRDTVQNGALAAQAQTLRPNELQAALASARSKAARDPEQARFASTLERVATEMRNGVRADAVGHMAKVAGVALPALDNTSSPEMFRERLTFAEATRAQYGQSNILRPQERDQLKSYMETADAAGIRDLASRMIAAGGSDARRLIGEMAEDAPAFAHLGDLALRPGAQSIAEDGFSGMVILRDNPNAIPKADHDERYKVINEHLSGALPEGSEVLNEQIIQAADAIYAARAKRRGIEAFDEKIYKGALRDAAGRTEVGGGVGKINGGKLLLPPDLNEKELSFNLQKMDADAWAELSMTGTSPVHGNGQKVSSEDLRKVQLVSVGPAHYQLKTKSGRFLLDETGGRFVGELSRSALSTAAANAEPREKIRRLERRIADFDKSAQRAGNNLGPAGETKAELEARLERWKAGDFGEDEPAQDPDPRKIEQPIIPMFF